MEKILRHRRMGFLVLAGSVILAFAAAPRASAQSSAPAPARSRNALVARADQPLGPVPAECEQGLSATPALRVDVAEIPLPEASPAAVQAPPSGALRAALQETQIALTRNDRPAFNDALESARSWLAMYPTGAERRTAEEIVHLHDAAAKLWDAQYQSPFFGEDDPVLATVSGWPGYAEAVRRSVLTDSKGRRFYPAAESRDFVTRLAGERLQRLGIQPGTRIARDTRAIEKPAAASTTRPKKTTTTSTTRMTSRSSTSRSNTARATTPRTVTPRTVTPRITTSRTATSRGSTSRGSAPRGSTPRATPAPTPITRSASASAAPSPKPKPQSGKPAPVTPAPGNPNPSAPPTTAADPAPVPVAVSQSNPDTAPAPAAGDVASATTATTATTTTASASTTDSSTPSVDTALSTDVIPPTPQPVRGRSVILPTILILIGLGVLIVLFRASK